MKLCKRIGILASWHVEQNDQGELFLPYTHFVYLKFASLMYESVHLIAPFSLKSNISKGYCKLDISNFVFIKLPYFTNYISALKYFTSFRKKIKDTANSIDLFYCRVPDPFSWMPALFTNKPVVMHFVGDTIDTTNHNEKWSWLKKKIMIAGYYPDYLLTILAARKSRVYTNGFHISQKIKNYGVKAIPVISSTIVKKEISNNFHELSKTKVRLIYVGYLRYAKGINTLKSTIMAMERKNIPYHFNIVGNGEMYANLKDFIEIQKLDNKVILHGHIDDRAELNRLFIQSDLFFFPSLSEGSPRVVIEAMSQGVPVMSTPVGSCPYVFKDKEDIRFFDFYNADQALSIIEEYLDDLTPFDNQRKLAFNRVKEKYTIEAFLSQVFSYEE